MPKFAYLIQAHSNFIVFKELILALQHPLVDIFIHIDKKVDIEPFKKIIDDNATYKKNAYFISDRVDVKWMGFSQVQATLHLLKYAVNNNEYSHISLISGADYPVKRIEEINDFLSKNIHSEFISFWRLSDRPTWLHKIEYYYPIDFIGIRNWKKDAFKLFFWGLFFSIRHLFPKRSFLKNIEPYGGSSWWTITGDAARFIVNFSCENTEFNNYYKYCHASDEMYFQTILLNSRFKENVFMYKEYTQWRNDCRSDEFEDNMLDEKLFNLRFIDWSGRNGFYPTVLDESDYKLILNSNCLFARKFDDKKSEKLLSMIKKNNSHE
ncbi:hypothetical protein J5069_22310 [Candidatus Symbiopectobacterium sp. NZEC127]|uniref:beta-1,6-N-acetylglucosaminyltransferase n=1 Tax=Candidatus Symbiopectobacterium sp. NZEC127 TaxID=2820472 RepID=UPI0022265AC6|nr:beta-1,6-N-acetylglucosaminyltransferase [Candidatus Symbiopectobacterium sp. NZEC127]MCW2488641.1 hypothetical protein [Candidatus Symbiopectobacterium sp. NZEC127]